MVRKGFPDWKIGRMLWGDLIEHAAVEGAAGRRVNSRRQAHRSEVSVGGQWQSVGGQWGQIVTSNKC